MKKWKLFLKTTCKSNILNRVFIHLNKEIEMPISAIKNIPVDFRENLNDIPLDISDRIFNEMKSQDAKCSYKKVQVLPTDPE